MLYYDRIVIFKRIDVSKTSASKECDACHYLYFLNYSFKFRLNVCIRCHDLLMMSINLSGIAILDIERFDYCWITNLISENEGINVMQSADLTKKSGIQNIKILFSYIKVGEEILTFGNTEIEKNKFYRHKTPIF